MRPMSDLKMVSLGDLVVDLNITVPRLPIEAEAHQVLQGVRLEPGGAGNFLLAGARLGVKMTALGVVGQDIYGDEMLSIFREAGIASDGVIRQAEGTTTLVFALSDAHGQHVFLGQIGEGPDAALTVDWQAAIRGADALHTFGYTLQEARLTDALLAGMAFARGLGKPVFFDPGPHAANVPFDLRRQALAQASAVLLTEDEIPILVEGGQGLADAQKLLSDTLTLVVVKRGAQGSVALTKDGGKVSHKGFPAKLLDATGAGDSFAAAFIAAWLQKRPLVEVLAIANAMGAAKVGKRGSGRQVPTLAEVRAVLGDAVKDF